MAFKPTTLAHWRVLGWLRHLAMVLSPLLLAVAADCAFRGLVLEDPDAFVKPCVDENGAVISLASLASRPTQGSRWTSAGKDYLVRGNYLIGAHFSPARGRYVETVYTRPGWNDGLLSWTVVCFAAATALAWVWWWLGHMFCRDGTCQYHLHVSDPWVCGHDPDTHRNDTRLFGMIPGWHTLLWTCAYCGRIPPGVQCPRCGGSFFDGSDVADKGLWATLPSRIPAAGMREPAGEGPEEGDWEVEADETADQLVGDLDREDLLVRRLCRWRDETVKEIQDDPTLSTDTKRTRLNYTQGLFGEKLRAVKLRATQKR